jgi:hypothetical protein
MYITPLTYVWHPASLLSYQYITDRLLKVSGGAGQLPLVLPAVQGSR